MDEEPSSSQESRNSLQYKPNPRRKPAHESVSLKRSSRLPARPPFSKVSPLIPPPNGSSSSSMDVDAASDASIGVEQPSSCQKQSSTESTNPEKWFEDSNNHLKASNPSFTDNEPPFFLQHSSSENTPPEVLARRAQEQAEAAASLEQLNQEDCSSEGFRSVIDDLTIENKRLKRRLKRYGRIRDSISHPEALFEVRVHGLPPDKKHELEEMLRNFVSKLDNTPRSGTNLSSSRSGVPSSLKPDLTSSSTSRIADSGYASWSASGQNSGSLSGLGGTAQKADDASMKQDRRQEIQTYLSDIPAGLLPHQMGPISSTNKKNVIVRRLEQLFAGRDPSGAHQQPIQQEKLAQSAARADRKATVPAGAQYKEGAREALIMNKNYAYSHKLSARLAVNHRNAIADSSKNDNASSSEDDSLIEQRPTRPLDLDPYRAQIPEENMEYMRHLGFSPPDSETMAEHEDGQGWIYLNVLHNMAQLHLANVPMAFVRKSINEHSKMLELSPDGRKLRWKGGHGVSLLSSNNSPADGSQSRHTGDGSKSSKQASESSGPGRATGPPNKFAYSPLFHREDSKTTDSGIEDDNYQISNVPAASSVPASSSGLAGSHSRADDAPIIFYQNTAFYTDLSGDAGVRARKLSAYHTVSLDPVGTKNAFDIEQLRKRANEKGPLSQPTAVVDNDARRPDGTPSSGSLKVLTDSDSPPASNPPDPMEFEASGLGGVQPADNFAISVRSRQATTRRQDRSATPSAARRSAYPKGIRRALQRSPLSRVQESEPADSQPKKAIVRREIIASNTHELPASRLPDGTYYHDSSDESDASSDAEMLDYESEAESVDDVPMTAPQRIDWATVTDGGRGEDEDEDEDEEDVSESDESMDLLATVRQYDPETVRLQEREFMSNNAEDQDIPAGSSAATAEGGSGFNSPVGGVVSAMADMGRRVPTLKRQRKSDDEERVMGRSAKSPKVDGL